MTSDDVDVVVVGAGIAGLAAARTLLRSGLDVAVLEARSRVGGRLRSIAAPGGGLDIGATWFWPNEPLVALLVSELGVATHPQHLDGDATYHDFNGTQRIRGNPIDVVSSRVTAGMQELAHATAREFPAGTLHLDHAVARIRLESSTVTAETAKGSFSGGHLILAVPPSLAVSSMEFVPGLDEVTVSIARSTPVWMGAITKVVARFSTPFWRNQGLAGAAISHVGPLREVHDTSGKDGDPAALFGFAPSTRPGQPTVRDDAVLGQLVEMFGADAASPEELVIRDWRHEPFTSPPGVEELQAYETFGHPCYRTPAFGGRLHWASTETSLAFPGHVEGALRAADSAAQAVLAARNA